MVEFDGGFAMIAFVCAWEIRAPALNKMRYVKKWGYDSKEEKFFCKISGSPVPSRNFSQLRVVYMVPCFIWKLGSGSQSQLGAFWRYGEAHGGVYRLPAPSGGRDPRLVTQNTFPSEPARLWEFWHRHRHPRANTFRLSNSPWELEHLGSPTVKGL